MSCILRISGEHLDVDKWIKKLPIKPYDIHKKGQTRIKTWPESKINKINKTSGMSFLASDADFDDLSKQIEESIVFLTKNKIILKKLISDKEVKGAELDFGRDLRVDEIAIQSNRLPPKLLKLAGGLNITITLSIYPV